MKSLEEVMGLQGPIGRIESKVDTVFTIVQGLLHPPEIETFFNSNFHRRSAFCDFELAIRYLLQRASLPCQISKTSSDWRLAVGEGQFLGLDEVRLNVAALVTWDR